MSKDHNSAIVGKVLIEFNKLDSTNAYALNLLTGNRPAEGTVIVTDHQTAGRGQMGTHWHSGSGKNLTFSIILYPDFLAATDQFYLNKAIAVALVTSLSPLLPGIRIKWPNDIYIQNRKLAGILIQNQIRGQHLQASVIGIGLNVRQTDFPSEVPNATSLLLEGVEVVSLNQLLKVILSGLDNHYRQLRQQPSSLDATYRHLLYRRQEATRFELSDGTTVEGYIQDVDASGRLEVSLNNGKKHFFSFKEIVYR